MRNEFLPMIDGPYYLIQIQSIFESGSLVYGDPPLAFYLLSVFPMVLGDISLGVKVGVSYFSALSTIPAYFLMRKIGKSRFCGFLAMILIVFSPPFIRMLSDFMKNAIGICWLLAFIYFINDLAFSGFNKRSIMLSSFFIILSGLTHILVFSVACLFLAFYAGLFLIFNSKRRQFLKAITPVLFSVLMFVFVASTFFGALFTDFNKLFSFIDALGESQSASALVSSPPLGRIAPSGELAVGPPPAGFTQGALHPPPSGGVPPMGQPPSFGMGAFSLSPIGGWILVFLLLFFGVLLSIYSWKIKNKEPSLILITTTTVGVVFSFPLIPAEWLGRFLLMMVIPTSIIISYGLTSLWNLKGNLKLPTIILTIICVSFFVGQSINTTEMLSPSISYSDYAVLIEMKTVVSGNSSIIAFGSPGFFYWAEYVTGATIIRPSEMANLESDSAMLGIFPRHFRLSTQSDIFYMGTTLILVEIQQNMLPNPN